MHPLWKDESGNIYGKLTVVEPVDKGDGRGHWLCQCECGEAFVVRGDGLRVGINTHCGCSRPRSKGRPGPDKSGNRYGRLLAIREVEKDKHGGRRWLCECDCGNEVVVGGSQLETGHTQSCGCSRRIDLAGKKFGRWEVINYVPSTDGIAYWRCICECGTERTLKSQTLRRGDSKSCGCYKRDMLRERMSLAPGESARRRVLYIYKSNARRRNIAWELCRDDFERIAQEPCHYCGAQSVQEMIASGKNGSFIYTGLDRKDSSDSYCLGNVVSCCAVCNRLKWNIPYDEFCSHIKAIYEYWASGHE